MFLVRTSRGRVLVENLPFDQACRVATLNMSEQPEVVNRRGRVVFGPDRDRIVGAA